MEIVQPKSFQLRIANIGFDSCNSSLKKFVETNAEKLLWKSNVIMAKELVTEKNMLHLLYALAIDILKETLNEPEKFNLLEEIKKLPELVKLFDITELTKKE